MAELGLRALPGGARLTNSITQYAIALNNYSAGPSAAFDGDLTTPYFANPGPPPDVWLGYVFPTAVQVAEFYITAPDSGNYIKAPTTFVIEGSNDAGVSWTSSATFTAATWTANNQVQTFTVVNLGGTGNPNGARGNIARDQIKGADRTGPGVLLAYSAAPAAHGSTGAVGQVAYDSSGNFYWCYATNSWARIGPGGFSNSF
jgi:hypothetical protein